MTKRELRYENNSNIGLFTRTQRNERRNETKSDKQNVKKHLEAEVKTPSIYVQLFSLLM